MLKLWAKIIGNEYTSAVTQDALGHSGDDISAHLIDIIKSVYHSKVHMPKYADQAESSLSFVCQT